MTTDRCGFSSFLPMSCRGRAEAFARRLQTRLQSLGRQPSGEDPNTSEQSWLTGAQHHVTSTSQPARLNSSSDSEVYFDFDVSPGSPLEEATEDFLHLNVGGCARIPAAAASVASPGSDDSSDNLYFDPEPGVVDLPHCNGHGDDVTDDAGVGLLCGATSRTRRPRVDYTKCNGVRRLQSSTETHEDRVGHSTETHEAEMRAHEAEVGHSTETHEAETRAHEAEAELETEMHEHSTETHEHETRIHEAETELETEMHEHSTETNEQETKVHEAEAELKAAMLEEDTRIHEAEFEIKSEMHEHSTESQEQETIVHEAQIELDNEMHKQDIETHEQEAKMNEAEAELETEMHEHSTEVHEHETRASEAEPASCEAVLPDNEVSATTHDCAGPAMPDFEITAAAPEPATEAARGVVREMGATRRLEVADDTDDEERPQRVRRCSSLKTGKTPPGTPGRKKIVRFADVLGLDLADVRTFLDEVPKVPTSAYEDLQDADLSSSLVNLAAVIGGALPTPDKTLVPMFVQPGGLADFFDRVREQQVCLENAIVSDVMLATISGTVRVRNLDFNKSVHIRYSVDAWKTYSDLQASYVQNSCDGFSDTFSFVMYAHTLTVGQRLEFAVRFQCHGCQYWDSNKGANYVFQCLPPTGQLTFRAHPPMSTCPDEQWASFY